MVFIAIEGGWSETASSNVRGLWALVFKLFLLDVKLRQAYKATTDGKFSETLRLFPTILHAIPVIDVDSV